MVFKNQNTLTDLISTCFLPLFIITVTAKTFPFFVDPAVKRYAREHSLQSSNCESHDIKLGVTAVCLLIYSFPGI